MDSGLSAALGGEVHVSEVQALLFTRATDRSKVFFRRLFIAALAPVALTACAATAGEASQTRSEAGYGNFGSPSEAYNAGRIEEAVRMSSGSGAAPDRAFRLAVMHWELGENARAADLLEGMAANPDLPESERDEALRELFITRVLMGAYGQAAAMRDSIGPILHRMDDRERAEFYFHDAWVFHETGDTAMAESLYRRSLDLYRWRSLAWLRLGWILQDRDPAGAEAAFRAAWNQDGALTSALLPLARLLADRGEWAQARGFLTTANARLPDDPETGALLAEALRNAPLPLPGGDPAWRPITAIPPRVTPAPLAPGDEPMRIGLAVDRALVTVRAGGAFDIRDERTGRLLHSGAAREQFLVESDGDGALVVRAADGGVLLRASFPITHRLRDAADTSIVAGVANANRTYRGALEFRPEAAGVTVVNIVGIEDYLYGVVPSEMPAGWPEAALQAQAIAARSYALAYRGTFADRGFDIWSTARSQVYGGVGVEHPRSTAAVDATRGMVLVGESGGVLSAYYSANHGGHSEDSLFLWGREAYMSAVTDIMLPPRESPLPPDELFRWLRDFPATYSNVPRFFFANTYRWERWIAPEEIRRRLAADWRIRQDPGEIRRIVTRGRGVSGRIAELEVQGSEGTVAVRGDAVWFTMGGLRSSLFTIRHKTDSDGRLLYLVFRGGGYGHGIGMDQHAAAAKADAGMDAEEILLHFYPRATLRQRF